MFDYTLTKKAIDDLNDIWFYTFDNWSEERANKYYEILISKFQLIAKNPEIGKIYLEISDGLFGLKVKKHIIFYQKTNSTTITVLRILHERMDIKNRLSNKK